MFDSPVDFCPQCKEMVLLDQTQRECVAEHHCRDGVTCPLQNCFSGYDFASQDKQRIQDNRHA